MRALAVPPRDSGSAVVKERPESRKQAPVVRDKVRRGQRAARGRGSQVAGGVAGRRTRGERGAGIGLGLGLGLGINRGVCRLYKDADKAHKKTQREWYVARLAHLVMGAESIPNTRSI